MAVTDLLNDTPAGVEGGGALPRRPLQDSAELDITPMIDITFLLLIFFLVASTPDSQTAVELPPAEHGKGVSEVNSVILTVADRGANQAPAVYVADGKVGAPLPEDTAAQEAAIIKAVEQGFFVDGKTNVLVKAEKNIKHRHVSRVAAAAGAAQVDTLQLHIAVLEVE